MSAWSEPLFKKDNGKDIYEQAEEFIKKTVEQKKKMVKENADEESLKK